jgi:hypothetical protein
LNERVVPYDLNTPLFTDYAHKLRTVWMPKGSAAKYSADAAFDFPVGTIFTKTFYYPLPDAANGGGPAVARTYDTALDFAGNQLGPAQRAPDRNAHPRAPRERLGSAAVCLELRAVRRRTRAHRR